MLNSQQTYYPRYKRFQKQLWKMHVNKKSDSDGKRLSLSNWIPELFFSFFFERYGYSNFDYIVAGNDPLLSMISALEKVSLGNKVIIYPSKTFDADERINDVVSMRTTMITESIVKYLNEKYELDLHKDMSLITLYEVLADRLNSFKDESDKPLCYLYVGHELYSYKGKSGQYKDSQVFWPRNKNNMPDESWDIISGILNKFSLIMKPREAKKKEVKSFITANKVILTTRTANNFCGHYYEHPISIGDAAFPMENMKKFDLRHRLADVLSAMSINQIENDGEVIDRFASMYGVSNAG